jgi:glycosyltransferase involved in cell wall biosynthesis
VFLQRVKFFASLARVRLLRLGLWFECLLQAIKLKLPINLVSFPLLPFLVWERANHSSSPKNCDTNLDKSVDVLVSLYQFEKHIPVLSKSLESCFTNSKITFHFVLVSPSPSEKSWLEKLVGNSHHKIQIATERVGIYSAWNLALNECTGEFITNLNADDIRLPHSICSQAASLQNSSYDGSYGNFVLSQDITSSLKDMDVKHLVSNLPTFNLERLLNDSQNLMHCAPMWKRDLHDRFGKFDESLKSSGDTEFWLRSLVNGARFSPYKPTTVIYFHNPEGLSTSLASIGRQEWSQIRGRHFKKALFGTS